MLKPVVALLVAIVSVQLGASLAQGLFAAVGPSGTTALRLALAAPMLIAALRPWRRRIARADWLPLAGYGATLGCMNLLFYSALRTVPLGVAVALEFCGPLALTLTTLRQPVDVLWIALAAAGVWVLLDVGGHAGVDLGGAALALGAGTCWALYIVAGRHIGPRLGTQAPALGTVLAACLIMPVGIAHAGLRALFAPAILGRAAAVALLSSAIPYTLEMVALTQLPASVFGTLTSLEPAVAALIGWAVLGQHLTPAQWCAMAAIMLGAAGATLTHRKPAPLQPCRHADEHAASVEPII